MVTNSPPLPRFWSLLQAAGLSISLALAIPLSFGAGVVLGAKDTAPGHAAAAPRAEAPAVRPLPIDNDYRVYVVSTEEERALLVAAVAAQSRASRRPALDFGMVFVEPSVMPAESIAPVLEMNLMRHGAGLPQVIVEDLRKR